MKELIERLKLDLRDERGRDVYAETVTNAFIAAQIKRLRDARKLSQQELAERIGTKQSGVSRLERADYTTWKVETLRKLASAFGVRLRIRFEPFGTLHEEIADFKEKSLAPPKFEDDPVFKDHHPLVRRTIKRKRPSTTPKGGGAKHKLRRPPVFSKRRISATSDSKATNTMPSGLGEGRFEPGNNKVSIKRPSPISNQIIRGLAQERTETKSG